jgi:hypothetical protein
MAKWMLVMPAATPMGTLQQVLSTFPGLAPHLVLDKNSPTALGLLWGEYAGGLRGIACAIWNVESQLGVNTAWV